MLDRVMLEVAEPLHPRMSVDGLAEMEKSGVPALNTFTIVVRELTSFPS
jgi:hypothetical protein